MMFTTAHYCPLHNQSEEIIVVSELGRMLHNLRLCVWRSGVSTRNLHKLRVVMDIDECMVHTKFHSHHGESVQLACLDGEPFYSLKRPHLHEYLKYVSSFADVYAFTAGMPTYAIPLLRHLDPEGEIFKKAWYRESCHIYNGMHVKNLEVMKEEYHEERTVLVDNNIVSFIAQPSNGIIVKDFYGDASDNVLESVGKLLHELHEDGGDVRPHLRSTFSLEEHITTERVNDFWRCVRKLEK